MPARYGLKNKNRYGTSLLALFSAWFFKKYVSWYILLSDQISSTVCLYRRSRKCFVRKGVKILSRSLVTDTCARAYFWWNCRPQACNFSPKETLAQVFSCEFCEISKNAVFTITSGGCFFRQAICVLELFVNQVVTS